MGNQIKQTVTNINNEQLDQIDRNQKRVTGLNRL